MDFEAEVVEWRGPAPYVFAVMPAGQAQEVADVARGLTYGWGCIPVSGRVGATDFTTSLFPREGGYYVPIKVAVQRAEGVGVGDTVRLRLTLGATPVR